MNVAPVIGRFNDAHLTHSVEAVRTLRARGIWPLIDSHLDRGAVQVEGARVTSAPSARLRNEAGARAVTVRVAPAPR